MLGRLVVSIIAVEAVVLALVILLWSFTHFRDELVARGWLSPNSWIVRNVAAAELGKTWRILTQLGFREITFKQSPAAWTPDI